MCDVRAGFIILHNSRWSCYLLKVARFHTVNKRHLTTEIMIECVLDSEFVDSRAVQAACGVIHKIQCMNKIWNKLTDFDCQSIHYLSEVHQNHCSWQWSDGIQNGGSILKAATACLCHGEYVLVTGSMAHLWAFPIRCLSDWWHSLTHLPLLSPQSWFIRLVSVTWHWHCPLLLLWKLPVGTFTIIWSPDGWKHQTETYTYTPSHTHIHTAHRLISLTLGLC